jgi:MFS family permease
MAALSPLAGPLARRFGARRLFLISVPPSVLALVAMASSDSVVAITFWRGVMAVFYATATIACQEYALRAHARQESAQPLGAFVAVVYAGVFCGSALGGVIAGRFGFETAFLAGAVLAVLSGCLGLVVLQGRAGDAVDVRASSRSSHTEPAIRDWRLFALLIGIAVPMNAGMAVVIWYLTPIALAAMDSGPAEIARVVMLYYLAAVLLGHRVSLLSDGRLGPLPLVLFGAFTSAGALFCLTLWGGFWAFTAMVAGLGIGHTLIRAPLFALVVRSSGTTGVGVNALRLTERAGAVLGLAASAPLLVDVGAQGTTAALGIVVLSGLVLYVIVEFVRRTEARSG